MRKRIFIAVELPEELREKITEVVKRWQWLPIRWTPPSNWHVTVVPPFYADENELKQVIGVVKSAVGDIRPFSLSFNAVILAPPGKEARMIWLSGRSSRGLRQLKEALEDKIFEAKIMPGFVKEGRAPIPHLTLARFEEGDLRELEEKTKMLEETPLSFEACELAIMESRLKITGAEYQTLATILLGEEEVHKPPFEFLPHTADLRIRAWGKTLEELFENSLLGMAEYMKKGAGSLAGRAARPVDDAGGDYTILLVNFLSSALTLADTHNEVYSRVNFEEFSETRLKGTLLGAAVDEFDEDIKAVTYHGAEIKKTDDGYEAIIIYDI